MTASLLAVSPAAQVEQIGAYLGYAAIVGLGVLALLYFAQARELKRLRDWVGDAPERGVSPAAAAEPRRVVAQPIAPATIAAQQAAAPLPPATLPPAGQLARSGPPAAPPAARPAPAVPPAARPAPAVPPPVTSGTVVAAPPAAATPVAAAAAHLAAARSAAANGTLNQETAESAAARPEPPVATPASAYEPADDGRSSLPSGRTGLLAGGGLLAVLVGIVLVVVMTGDDPAPAPNDFGNTPARTTDDTPSSSASGSGSSGSSSSALTTADRRAITVTVLNGTTQTGLARTVADRISEADFKVQPPATNSDQSVPATVVSYVSGKQRAALAVAKAIDVDSSAVQPGAATTTAAAGSDVVVVVGADKIG